jgi:hypothetical protein
MTGLWFGSVAVRKYHVCSIFWFGNLWLMTLANRDPRGNADVIVNTALARSRIENHNRLGHMLNSADHRSPNNMWGIL